MAAVLNPLSDDWVFWQGHNPGTAACRAGPVLRHMGTTTGETVGGLIRTETFRIPGRSTSFEGRTPRVLAVRNKTAQESKGVNRQEGDRTLKAQRSESGKLTTSGPSILASAEGTGSPREELICYGGSARVNRVTLWRKTELEERRFDRALKGSRPSLSREIHKAEERPTAMWDR